MIRLWGTPEKIGAIWGKLNQKAICVDVDATYLRRAAEADIDRKTLVERAARYVRIVQHIAPHWLDEARAIAQATGIDEDLYPAFLGSVSRGRFLKADVAPAAPDPDPEIVECTSYAIPRQRARNKAIFFHKTRDNVDRPQVAILVESSLQSINKFIAVADVSLNGLSMVVNDKGLAAAADYPADRKKESSTLVLPQAEPCYSGLMGGAIIRYVAERAESSPQALAMLEDFVSKGYYAGGDVNGQHWLFVDRQGVIVEACSNSRHVVSMTHTQEPYFSRFNQSEPVVHLRQADSVDFRMFRGVSRQAPLLTGQSISSLTVEIDPDHPDLLTVAWVALPARTAAFPLFMGQWRTPRPLADTTAYALGKSTASRGADWEAQKTRWADMEAAMHADKEELVSEVRDSIIAGNPLEADIERLESWSQDQAAAILETFRTLGNTDGGSTLAQPEGTGEARQRG